MAIIVHFHPKGLNATTYAEVMKRLASAGAAAPRGRLHHVAYGPPESLSVVDVYATAGDFEAFGGTLMPILGALGVDPGKPEIAQVTDVVRGP